jgi:hypothetical protein
VPALLNERSAGLRRDDLWALGWDSARRAVGHSDLADARLAAEREEMQRVDSLDGGQLDRQLGGELEAAAEG